MTTSPENPINLQQVLDLFETKNLNWAENLTEYANLRANGQRQIDAMREMGIRSDATVFRYERATAQLRRHLGLPPLSASSDYGRKAQFTSLSPNTIQRASFSGKHSRWHVGRGKIDSECALCQQDTGRNPK